jgi:hypothetical protein
LQKNIANRTLEVAMVKAGETKGQGHLQTLPSMFGE